MNNTVNSKVAVNVAIAKTIAINDTVNVIDAEKFHLWNDFNVSDFSVSVDFNFNRYVDEEEAEIITDEITLDIHVRDFSVKEVSYLVYRSDCDYGISEEGLRSFIDINEPIDVGNLQTMFNSSVNIAVKAVADILVVFTPYTIKEMEVK